AKNGVVVDAPVLPKLASELGAAPVNALAFVATRDGRADEGIVWQLVQRCLRRRRRSGQLSWPTQDRRNAGSRARCERKETYGNVRMERSENGQDLHASGKFKASSGSGCVDAFRERICNFYSRTR